MSFYRRLLEWLAKPLIQAERAELLWERLRCAAGIRMNLDAAYLKGHHDGEEQILDKLARVILARGGEPNSMTAEDLANCRKGLTH